MDYLLATDSSTPPQMVFNACINDILNNVVLSLQTKQGAMFSAPGFGSQLYKVTDTSDGSVAMARMYCADALSWIVRVGKAKNIEVFSRRCSSGIEIDVSIAQVNGEHLMYTYFHRIA